MYRRAFIAGVVAIWEWLHRLAEQQPILRDRMVSTRAILKTKTKTRTTMIGIRLLKLKLELKY